MSLVQEQRLLQQQKLSPAQILAVKLVELPTIELEQRVAQELEENVALEEGPDTADSEVKDEERDLWEEEEDSYDRDERDIADFIPDDDYDDYNDYHTKSNNSSPDDKHEDIPFSAGVTFQEYLKDQFNLLHLTKHQKQIGIFIIGNLDDYGYLRREIESIVDDLAFHENVTTTEEEVEAVLEQIQELEPAGVGARDLRECLLLQLNMKTSSPTTQISIRVLTQCFEEYSKKHFDKICQKLAISEEDFRAADAEIRHLNPLPGSAWGGNAYEKAQGTIIPDFRIEANDGNFTIALNTGNIPELHVSQEYTNMLEACQSATDRSSKEAAQFIRKNLDAARWFIDAIRQRNETLFKTMTAILEYQKDFFLEGDVSMLKPMILKDIADRTGYDVSTISRVSNSKYVETEFGVFALKYFFSESMTNESGDEISTRQIKQAMLEIISAEDGKAPYNDDKLVEILKIQGFVLARRTIAKYREQLGIPVARLRKQA